MNFLKLNFSPLKKIFFELFFLFLIANCVKFKMQKEKSKKIFYIGKKTAKWSLVILFALVIYTAPTVSLVCNGPLKFLCLGSKINQNCHFNFECA